MSQRFDTLALEHVHVVFVTTAGSEFRERVMEHVMVAHIEHEEVVEGDFDQENWEPAFAILASLTHL